MNFPEPFELLLSADFPYAGKLVTFTKRELAGDGEFSPTPGVSMNYTVTDRDVVAEFDEEATVYAFVTASHRNVVSYSLALGMFKHVVLHYPGIGVEAEVVEHDRNLLRLSYYGVRLRLKKSDLEITTNGRSLRCTSPTFQPAPRSRFN